MALLPDQPIDRAGDIIGAIVVAAMMILIIAMPFILLYPRSRSSSGGQ